MSKEPENVEDVLDELDELASSKDEVYIADVLDDFGARSFGPFIMIPALLEITPIGGIPGLPTFLAFFIAIVAVQMLMGRDHIWMPEFIRCRAVTGEKLHSAVEKLRGLGSWPDNHVKGRLERLTHGWWVKLAATVIIALCCTVPPLEFLPFASSLPMLAIAILGLALTVRDGALMLAALIFAGVAAAIGMVMYTGSGGGTGGWV